MLLRSRASIRTFLGADGFQVKHIVFVAQPRVHFAVRLASFLCQFIPVLGLGEKLADRTLAQTQHVLCKQALTDVMRAQHLADPGTDFSRIEYLC